MVPLNPQPARVVNYIVYHAVKLVLVLQDAVMIVTLPQWLGYIHLAGCETARLLEAVNDSAKMHIGLLGHKEDAMEMVRHKLASKHFHMRVMRWDLVPIAFHGITKRRRLHPCHMVLIRTTERAQQVAAASDNNRYHVDAPPVIVMTCHAASHLGLLLVFSSIPLPPLLSLHIAIVIHRCKNSSFLHFKQIKR
jgi:hypothetical protein